MYHKVDISSPTMWWVEVDNFYRHMVEISNKTIVYLDEYDHDNPNHVVITFDGVYKNIHQYAKPILEHFGFPFELFISESYIGRNNSFDTTEPLCEFANYEELESLVKIGGRLQWHTVSHPDMNSLTESSLIDKELTVPEGLLDLDPSGFKWFAYPYGEFNNKVMREVMLRFSGAVSCHQGDNISKYRYNRLTVKNTTHLRVERIACIISSFNYGSFLADAIESVLRQTILPDEILITDDCSSDDTRQIAEFYVRSHPTLISYNRNEENLGVVGNFNKAVGLVTSELIVILGADNRLMSNYIEKCFLEISKKEIAIAYTDFAFFGPLAQIAYSRMPSEFRGSWDNNFYKICFPVFSQTSIKDLRERNFIHGSSMYRRTAFLEVGGYLKKENQPEDYDLFLRVIGAGYSAAKAQGTYLEYRQHSIGQENNKLISYQQLIIYKTLTRELRRELDLIKKSKTYRIYYFFTLIKLTNIVRVAKSIKKIGLISTSAAILKRLSKARQ